VTWSCPIVEQLQGPLYAAGEELVGQVAGGQRSGELQGADHHSEDRERVGSFDQTLAALAYVEDGRANGKVVITLD
jgi:hypothetical protein